MTSFKKFFSKSGLDVEPETFEIIKINNQHYLRFYNKDHKASTIALEQGSNNKIITGSTVCTSSACASCCGCVPNGDYCSTCKPQGEDSSVTGDCERVTLGG